MNTDIVWLLDKAERSLSAARLLLDQEHHDFAISRAYYAMFYVLRAFLLRWEKPIQVTLQSSRRLDGNLPRQESSIQSFIAG